MPKKKKIAISENPNEKVVYGLELQLAGFKAKDAAKTAGVSVVALREFRGSEDGRKLAHEFYSEVSTRVRGLQNKALDTIEELLSSEDEAVQLKAVEAIFKGLNHGQKQAESGTTNAAVMARDIYINAQQAPKLVEDIIEITQTQDGEV